MHAIGTKHPILDGQAVSALHPGLHPALPPIHGPVHPILHQIAGHIGTAANSVPIVHAMSAEAQITALLHVAAVVTVLTLAFLGLDDSHVVEPNYKAGLESAKTTAKTVRERLGYNDAKPERLWGRNFFRRMHIVFPLAIVCLLANAISPLNRPLKFVHIFYRQRHVPLFGYFTKFNHMRVIGYCAVFSTLVFLFSAASIIWNNEWMVTAYDGWPLTLFFILLSLTLGWLMWTGAAMRALEGKRLHQMCHAIGDKVGALLEAVQREEKAKNAATRALLKAQLAKHLVDLKEEVAEAQRVMEELEHDESAAESAEATPSQPSDAADSKAPPPDVEPPHRKE